MKTRKIPTEQHVIDYAVELAGCGLQAKEIKDALTAKFGGRFWIKDVQDWTSTAREAYRLRNKTAAEGMVVSRYTLLMYPEDVDHENPYLRNLWAHLVSASVNRQPWFVFRSPFFRGQRAYRVVPDSRAPFVLWCATPEEFVRKLRKHGIEAVWHCDSWEHEPAPQAELFNIDTAPGRRVAA